MDLLFSTIIFAGAIQGFFLVLVILRNENVKKESKFFLILILLFFSMNIILNEVIQNIARTKPDFIITTGALQLSLGPMVYLYIRSLTEKGFKHKPTDTLHFLPMLFYFIIIVLIHIRRELIPLLGIINKFMWTIVIIQIFVYMIIVQKKISLFNHGLKDSFSTIEKMNLNWLNFILVSFLILLASYFILFVIIIHDLRSNTIINRSLSLILSFFIYLFGYKGLMQKNIPTEKSENKIKYSKSLLPAEYMEYWKKKLMDYLEKEKPYLNEELSLISLSNKLGIPPNQLSQIINSGLNTTFFDLINEFRIDEVKKLLTADKGKNILDLAFQSGFNSKTTFNVVFKKKTGLTPTQYKNSII